MCGICGYITKKNIENDVLVKMNDMLTHRGPDDTGVEYFDNGTWHIGLGHKRLSIQDLSSMGHQPMRDVSGRYTIVFNGEIYNYLEIRDKLLEENRELKFKSKTDTEVLLYAYIRYGQNCLDMLNGMFAFVIYDEHSNTLFMARDRIGKKPLYYYVVNDSFVFASELKSIMQYVGFVKEIDKSVLVQYFAQNTILSGRTIFKNTFKLEPGECLIWDGGRITKSKYYDLIEQYNEGKKQQENDYSICKDKLKNLLYDSVEKRLIADVPSGSFLSGGIDSTLISAIATDISTDRFDTFSIGFDDKECNEADEARVISKHLGTKHHEMIMAEKNLKEVLADIVYYYDEPFSDPSELPTMLVAKFARENVTMVLSGDGGDELFAGYTSNDTINFLEKYDGVLSTFRNMIPESICNNMVSDRFKILFEKKSEEGKYQYYAQMKENLAKNILNSVTNNLYIPGIVALKDMEDVNGMQDKRMLVDMLTYLPDEVLTKTDRASMRYSLEMRAPLLDYRIVDYSLRIPREYKYNKGDKKHILKDILYDYVPKELMDRPKKGFTPPIYRWLKQDLYPSLYRYADKRILVRQGIFDAEGVAWLLSRFLKKDENATTQVVWSFYMFQMWYSYYIEDLWN